MSGETVWLLPRQGGATDAHGNTVWTWDVEVPVDGAKVAPRPGEEPEQLPRETVIVGLSVLLPPGVRLSAVDRMKVRGEVYKVIGEPGVWVSPWTGREWGVQVALERVEG